MTLNSICIRKNLSEIIRFGQVMGRFITYIMEGAVLLVVVMRPLQSMVATKNLMLEVTTTIIWMSWSMTHLDIGIVMSSMDLM